jgi:hypothetical protein
MKLTIWAPVTSFTNSQSIKPQQILHLQLQNHDSEVNLSPTNLVEIDSFEMICLEITL